MQLSVIIVSWNTSALLRQCLASIFANPPSILFEVFVVDNASTDGSAGMIERYYPQVRLIRNTLNVGFAAANNQAIQECIGQYVLLLNPDTEVAPGALDVLIGFMEICPQAGAAGAQLVNPDGTLQPSCFPAPTLFGELLRLFHLDHWTRYEMERWDLRAARPVDVVQGACLLLRRKALHQVGLLDPDYFIYTEEVDLCYRLRTAGWSIYWIPEAKVLHYGGQSTQQLAGEMFLQLYQSKLLYIRKHYGKRAGRVYKLILLAATLARLVISPLASLQEPQRRQHCLILARQYFQLATAIWGF